MPKCPSCSKQELPVYDWLVFGQAKCRACSTFVERGAFAKKYGGRSIHLVPLALVSVAILTQGISRKYFIVGGIFGFVVWLLALYFSRPVPYSGEYPVGPSRPERMLAPVILVFGAGLLIYAIYLLFAEP